MKLHSKGIKHGAPIDERFGFCALNPDTHAALSANRNPDFTWSELPEGTRSLALICHDSDVPTEGTHVNTEGTTVPASLPRTDFTHWVIANLPADSEGIVEGEFSDGVTAHGKDAHHGPQGTIQGLNDYTGWFATDPGMAGDYIGYDGPCPPWNDELVHHYHFTLVALDISELTVPERFTRQDLLDAMADHQLGSAELVATFTLNPDLR